MDDCEVVDELAALAVFFYHPIKHPVLLVTLNWQGESEGEWVHLIHWVNLNWLGESYKTPSSFGESELAG